MDSNTYIWIKTQIYGYKYIYMDTNTDIWIQIRTDIPGYKYKYTNIKCYKYIYSYVYVS